MIPWIIFAVVVVPLVVIAFVAMRRKAAAGELLDDEAQARAEEEFAEAEAYDAEWREKDEEKSRQERFP
jgi:uncharacterized membrane protein